MFKGKTYYWLIGILTLIYAGLSYYGQTIHGYPVPPGDDIFNHLRAMENLQSDPVLWQAGGGYPIGFRVLMVLLANVFLQGNLTDILLIIWPILPVLSVLALWLLATKLFSKKIGLAVFVLYGFMSLQPLLTVYDGGLPNLFASNIFLPLSLLFWVKIWKDLRHGWIKTKWAILGFVLTSAIILYSHHLSSIVWAGTIGLSFIGLSVWRGQQFSGAKRWKWPVLSVVIFGSIALILLKTPIFDSVNGLIELVKSYDSPTDPWEWSRYHTSINGLLFQGGILGLLLLGYRRIFIDKKIRAAEIVIISWFLLYLVGSRLSFVAEPERLARDLAMPGAILAGYFIIEVAKYLRNKNTIGYKLFIAFIIIQVALGVAVKAQRMTEYNPMVRFSSSDQELLETIKSTEGTAGVQVQNGGWGYVLKDDIDAKKVILLRRYSTVKKRFKENQCVYLSYYKSQVWPPESQSRALLDRVITNADKLDVSVEPFIEDPLKYWYKACPN